MFFVPLPEFFFARINLVVDIYALQFDRLWAISMPLYHHSEVTSSLSWKIVISAKIFTLLIVILASVTEPSLVKYQQCHRCIFVHPVNVWLHSFPALAAFLLTLAVSIFASAKVIKLNKVSPAISIGRNTTNILEQQQRNHGEIEKQKHQVDVVKPGVKVSQANWVNKAHLLEILNEIDCQADVRFQGVSQSVNTNGSNKEKAERTNVDLTEKAETLTESELCMVRNNIPYKAHLLNELHDVESCEIDFPMPSTSSYSKTQAKTERNTNKTEDIPKHPGWENNEERKDHTRIRKEDNIHEGCVKETPLLDILRKVEISDDKSYRTSNQISSIRNKEGQRLRNNVDLTRMRGHCKTMLVSTLKMNLLTMVLVVFIVPRHLLAIYYKSCYLTPGGCDEFFKMFLGISFMQICVTFIFPFVLIRVIDKIC